MTILTILFGLIGLGIVVFVHELGHFTFARLCGVEVEEFSLGWGPKLWGFRRGKTTYRLSMLPIGGYCKMKGDEAYRKAIEQNLDAFPLEPGSYHSAHPLKRIIISIGGPLFNVIFAMLVFITIALVGQTIHTFPNRIIVADDYLSTPTVLPARAAGLQTGDFITTINGRATASFGDIQKVVSMSAGQDLVLSVRRGETDLTLRLKPSLDTDTGAGRIGIYPWVDPVVGSVSPDGPAYIAGIKPGDRIIAVAGIAINHYIGLTAFLQEQTPAGLDCEILRSGERLTVRIVPGYSEAGIDLGIGWQTLDLLIRSDNFIMAIGNGIKETFSNIGGTLHGLATLFKGVNPLKALSGPARITWLVGQVATDGFESGLQSGLTSSFNFLAILSIGLSIMNLLPIPVLDGGWIVLFLLELVRGRPVKVKTVFRYQLIGVFALLALFLLTTIGDILFFGK